MVALPARERQAARPVVLSVPAPDAAVQIDLPPSPASSRAVLSPCEHRTVARDGRIICTRIVEGQAEVSPNVCRDCPYKTVNCAHLRFCLRQSSSTPLLVRYNGRTELWNDGSPALRFERAACALRATPVHDPRSCAGCSLRQPLLPASAPPSTGPRGKVVPFPSRPVRTAVDGLAAG